MEEREKKNKKPAVKLALSPHALFMPMLEDLRPVTTSTKWSFRVTKACDLLDAGVPLFPNDFRKQHDINWVLETYGPLEGEELDRQEDVFAVAGRIVSLRSFGKVAFFHIMDQTGRIQGYASREHMAAEDYAIVKKLDVGDIVGLSGHLFRTKTGELTVACRHIKRSPAPCDLCGKVPRPQRFGNALPPALCGPDCHAAGTRDFFEAQPYCARIPPFYGRQRLRGSGNAHDAAPGRRGYGQALQNAPQCPDLDLFFLRIAPEFYLKRLLGGRL